MCVKKEYNYTQHCISDQNLDIEIVYYLNMISSIYYTPICG